jgi:Ser/Thr protein kinase RdoA (MazF antagonist)
MLECMPGDDLYEVARGVLAAAGARIGVSVRDARLVGLHSNAIFVLPSAGLVIRIATNPAAIARVAESLRVTRWLSARRFPCVVPAQVGGQPLVIDGFAVSVWQYVPVAADASPGIAELGLLLRILHDGPLPPEPPAELVDPFDSVASAIEDVPSALSSRDHEWLDKRIAELRQLWQTIEYPHTPCMIHGDAHPGNLIRTTGGRVILGDWDHVATGPREWDLAQVHYFRRRFGEPSAADVDIFAEAYGWDARQWPELFSMIAIREVTGLSSYIRTSTVKPFSRHELARRVRSLREGDTTTWWNLPPADQVGPTP